MRCSRVLPSLYVGPDPRDDEDFQYLRSLGITSILSLRDDDDYGPVGMEYERRAAVRAGMDFAAVPIKDFSSADLTLRLPECVRELSRLLSRGHRVYVHCTAGINRSPTVVVAYLHWVLEWDLERALSHVLDCRMCVPDEKAIRHATWCAQAE